MEFTINLTEDEQQILKRQMENLDFENLEEYISYIVDVEKVKCLDSEEFVKQPDAHIFMEAIKVLLGKFLESTTEQGDELEKILAIRIKDLVLNDPFVLAELYRSVELTEWMNSYISSRKKYS